MPHITTCSKCGRLYEEASEEASNNPDRLCLGCHRESLGDAAPPTFYTADPAGLDFTRVAVFRVYRDGRRKPLYTSRIPSLRVSELLEELQARGITPFAPTPTGRHP
jgi:hypothetical protein